MEVQTLWSQDFPRLLREIPTCPKKLYVEGNSSLLRDEARLTNNTVPACIEEMKFLCVVGARKYSQYGKDACRELILGLRGYNICIVSGLALGIDSIAHEAALEAGLPTMAFPGSGLNRDVLYPAHNQRLARRIVEAHGALVSEFDMNFRAVDWCFPQRNRLMAGISHATLVIEAAENSGTMITSRLALDFNRDVMAVPGSIFSSLSFGPNRLIYGGATPIRNAGDILYVLGIRERSIEKSEEEQSMRLSSKCTADEKKVLELLACPISKDELVKYLAADHGIHIQEANIILSMMELGGLIGEERGLLFAKKITSV